MKLSAHTDANPTRPTSSSTVTLSLRNGDQWKETATAEINPLTAMAEIRLEEWDTTGPVDYRVVCGESELTGTIRAEPRPNDVIKLMTVACVNDKWFPYSNAGKYRASPAQEITMTVSATS